MNNKPTHKFYYSRKHKKNLELLGITRRNTINGVEYTEAVKVDDDNPCFDDSILVDVSTCDNIEVIYEKE